MVPLVFLAVRVIPGGNLVQNQYYNTFLVSCINVVYFCNRNTVSSCVHLMPCSEVRHFLS